MTETNNLDSMSVFELSLKKIMIGQINQGYFDRKILRYHTDKRRRAYKLVMANYFTSSFLNDEKHFNWAQHYASLFYLSAEIKDYKMITDEIVDEVTKESLLYLGLQNNFLFFSKEDGSVNDTILNTYIDFINKYLKDTTTLYLYKDIKEFWNLNALFNDVELLDFYWIDLRFFEYNIPIYTFPEYFAYQDVINLWNETIDKYEKLGDLNSKGMSVTEREYRTISYSLVTLLRSTYVAGVHYFETYLYYVYYNLKYKNKFTTNKVIKRNDIRKIIDKVIIEELLYKEYPALKDKSKIIYEEYKKILENRDAFVHMSAFEENGASRMQYLLAIDMEVLESGLNTIFKFINLIEEDLGEDNILFWYKFFDEIDFKERKKLSNIIW